MVRRNYRAAAEQRAEEVRRRLEYLQGRHLQLTVRATLLALLLRVRREIAAHWHRCGGDPAHGQLLEERAQALAQTGVTTNSGGLEDRFEHLRPGVSLLQLESVPLARVEAVQRMTLADVAAAMTAFHRRASDAAALLSSGCAAPQQLAVAAAIVSAMGREMLELHYLLIVWNAPVYHAFSIHRFDTIEPVMTVAVDAPMTHWDVVLRRMRLSREQALFQIDNGCLLLQRVERMQSDRGSLLQDFSVLDQQGTRHGLGAAFAASTDAPRGDQPLLQARGAGGLPPQARSGGSGSGNDGGGGNDSGGGSGGGAAFSLAPPLSSGVVTLEELVNELEDNVTSEGVVRREGSMVR